MNSVSKHPLEKRVPKRLDTPFVRNFFGVSQIVDLLTSLPQGAGYTDVYDELQSRYGISRSVSGLSHIPQDGPLIVSANHPHFFYDFLSLGSTLEENRPNSQIKTVGNSASGLLQGVDHLLLPYMGDLDDYNMRVTELLNEDGTLIIFPAGETSYRSFGKLIEKPWKKGVLHASEENEVDILPVNISAQTGPIYNTSKNIFPRKFMEKFNLTQAKRLGTNVDMIIGENIKAGEITDPAILRKLVMGLR